MKRKIILFLLLIGLLFASKYCWCQLRVEPLIVAQVEWNNSFVKDILPLNGGSALTLNPMLGAEFDLPFGGIAVLGGLAQQKYSLNAAFDLRNLDEDIAMSADINATIGFIQPSMGLRAFVTNNKDSRLYVAYTHRWFIPRLNLQGQIETEDDDLDLADYAGLLDLGKGVFSAGSDMIGLGGEVRLGAYLGLFAELQLKKSRFRINVPSFREISDDLQDINDEIGEDVFDPDLLDGLAGRLKSRFSRSSIRGVMGVSLYFGARGS